MRLPDRRFDRPPWRSLASISVSFPMSSDGFVPSLRTVCSLFISPDASVSMCSIYDCCVHPAELSMVGRFLFFSSFFLKKNK